MIFLRLLGIIDIYFSQAKGKTNNDTTVLGNWILLIIIGDFYQFSLVIGRFL